MYALVEVGGEQFRAEKGRKITTQKLEGESGASVTFDRVLMVADGDNVTIGQPTVSGAVVKGTIVDQYREKKIIVFKKKRRKGYKKTRGHRQHKTAVQIDGIEV